MSFFVVFRVLVLDFRVLGCEMLFCVVVDGFAFFWFVFARVLQLEMLPVFFFVRFKFPIGLNCRFLSFLGFVFLIF